MTEQEATSIGIDGAEDGGGATCPKAGCEEMLEKPMTTLSATSVISLPVHDS